MTWTRRAGFGSTPLGNIIPSITAGQDFLRFLGFTRRRGLDKATYSPVFRRIDVADFESRVSQRLQGQLTSDDAPHLASDGKPARGCRDGETPGIHSVPAYVPHVRAVVGQPRADTKTDEHKAARERLGVRPVKGTIVTGDALFRHRDVRAKVIEGGGGYVLPVKENQSTSRAGIVAAFAEPEAGPSPLQTARRAGSIDRACGQVGGSTGVAPQPQPSDGWPG